MNKTIFALALAFATMGAAQAQQAPEKMHYFVGMGATWGGDKLAKAYYADGDTVNIRAGDGFAFVGGIDYRVNPSFSFQGSVAYHTDTTSASNGSVRFSRVPLEVLAYYHLNEEWRIGAGARHTGSVKMTGHGFGSDANAQFDNANGSIIEAEYLSDNHWGVKLRYVSEKFTVSHTPYKVNGNHFGVFANYYY